MRRGRRARFRLFLIALAVLGATLVLLRQTLHGLTLKEDSSVYVSVARNLWQGNGFVHWSGAPFGSIWPPGYPLTLAAASLGLFDPLAVAGPLNAVVHGVTVFAAGHWLRRRLTSRWLAAAGCCGVAFGAPLIGTSTNILSDSLFILYVTLALIQTGRVLTGEGGPAALPGAAAGAGLAVLTRYAGLPLIAALLVCLAAQPGVSPGARVRRLGTFALVALGPLGAWLYRNYLVTGTFTHMDAFRPERPLADSVFGMFQALAEWAWFAPLNDVTVARGHWAVWAAWIAVAGGGFLLGRGRRASREGYADWWMCQGFVLAYLGFIGIATLSLVVTGPSHRYLAAVYIPLWFILLFVADQTRLRAAAHRTSRPGIRASLSKLAGALSVAPALMLAAWAGTGILVGLRTSVVPEPSPVDPALPYLRGRASPALQYMQAHLTSGLIFSNIPYRTYIRASRQTQHRWLPSNPVDDLLPWLTEQSQNHGDTYVVFFHSDPGFRDYRFLSAADLRGAGVEPLAELADGNVFKVSPGPLRRPDGSPDAPRAGAPAVRSVFDVHLADGALHFVKQPCFGTDTQLRFFLHAVPLRVRDLPAARRALGFANLDFYFSQYGVRRNEVCWATVPLPAYALARLRVGQLDAPAPNRDGQAWMAEIPDPGVPAAVARALRAEGAAVRAGAPALRSVFDVYLTARAVRFVKTPCRPADTEPRFILHVLPVQSWRLPWRRRPAGFDNLDFSFREQGGTRFEGQCWVSAALPAYAIDRIRVGQFDSARQRDVWKETLPVP